MTSTPNPVLIDVYEAKLAQLIAEREQYRAQRNGHRVRLLNRQVRAQLKWIKRAELVESTTRGR